jgi:hypothetical protein
MSKRNVIFNKRNDIFFGTETENRNDTNIFQKRNKKKRFSTPGISICQQMELLKN